MKDVLHSALLLIGLAGGCTADSREHAQKAPGSLVQAADSLPAAPFSTGKSTFRVSVTPTDSSLVFPVVRRPANLCRALEQAWQAYLRQHPAFKHRFPMEARPPMEAGPRGMSTSFWLRLDKRGRVQAVSLVSSTALAACCYHALRSTLAATRWRPLYRKTRAGKRYLPLEVLVNCYLSPTYRLTTRLDGYGPIVSHGLGPCEQRRRGGVGQQKA